MAEPFSLIVCGAAGRMGRCIIALASQRPDLEVKAAIEAPGHPAVGSDAGDVAGAGSLGVAVGDDLAAVISPQAVCLDFSSAEASLANMRLASDQTAPIVIGSTGFSPAQQEEAEKLATGMPTIMAANVSLGINVLLELVGQAVRRLGPGFDCEIVEIHHNRKKDAPSGTALALAEAAALAGGQNPEDSLVLARQGMVGARTESEIGVVALRGGDTAGEHTVMLAGAGERLELTHRALSRDCLASGAIRAAIWLTGRPAGLYSMQDVLDAHQ